MTHLVWALVAAYLGTFALLLVRAWVLSRRAQTELFARTASVSARLAVLEAEADPLKVRALEDRVGKLELGRDLA